MPWEIFGLGGEVLRVDGEIRAWSMENCEGIEHVDVANDRYLRMRLQGMQPPLAALVDIVQTGEGFAIRWENTAIATFAGPLADQVRTGLEQLGAKARIVTEMIIEFDEYDDEDERDLDLQIRVPEETSR